VECGDILETSSADVDTVQIPGAADIIGEEGGSWSKAWSIATSIRLLKPSAEETVGLNQEIQGSGLGLCVLSRREYLVGSPDARPMATARAPVTKTDRPNTSPRASDIHVSSTNDDAASSVQITSGPGQSAEPTAISGNSQSLRLSGEWSA
jgi:hypothetical protein